MDILKRNNVKVEGKGEKYMMFSHGFGCDQNVWRFITPAFYSDYKLILFDNVGAGKSDLSAYDPDKYNTLQGYADDVIEILDALKVDKVIFVGHSVASMFGVLAGISHPERFEKIIMVGPSPRYLNDNLDYFGGFELADMDSLMETMDSNYLGWSGAMAPVIMGNPDKPELGQELTNNFCSTDPAIAREFARVTFYSDNRQDLTKLNIESLILQCDEDVIAPKAVGEYIHKILPNSKIVMMKATGHCPHMSAPEETIEAIKAFL